MANKTSKPVIGVLAPLLGAVGAIVLAQPGLFTPVSPPPRAVDAYGIAVGMTKADVLNTLGLPDQQRGECWIWLDTDQYRAYTVTFEDGKVKYSGPAAD